MEREQGLQGSKYRDFELSTVLVHGLNTATPHYFRTSARGRRATKALVQETNAKIRDKMFGYVYTKTYRDLQWLNSEREQDG